MRTAWKQLAAEAWTTLRAVPQAVRQRWRPEPGRFVEPHFPPRWLLVVATCVLVALACILLGSRLSRPKPEATFDLPADPQASNLKVDSRVEEPVPPPEPPAEPAKLEVTAATPLPSAPSGPPVPEEKKAEPPPAEEPVESREPTIELITAMPHEGDDTMSTKGNFALQMFLLGWYLTNPAAYVNAGDQGAGEPASRLDKIDRNIADLQKKLDDFMKEANLKEVKDKLGQLQQSLDGFKTSALQNKMKLDDTASSADAHAKDLAALRRDGNKLAEEVAKLSAAIEQLAEARSEARKAFSPAPMPAGPIIPPGIASTIRLVNAWSTPMTVIVDETSHRLQPGEVKNVPRRAGNFSYEVLAVQPLRTRTIVAGETFTIRIAPQP